MSNETTPASGASGEQELTDDQIETTAGTPAPSGDLGNWGDKKKIDPKRSGDGANGDVNDMTGVNDVDSTNNNDSNRHDE